MASHKLFRIYFSQFHILLWLVKDTCGVREAPEMWSFNARDPYDFEVPDKLVDAERMSLQVSSDHRITKLPMTIVTHSIPFDKNHFDFDHEDWMVFDVPNSQNEQMIASYSPDIAKELKLSTIIRAPSDITISYQVHLTTNETIVTPSLSVFLVSHGNKTLLKSEKSPELWSSSSLHVQTDSESQLLFVGILNAEGNQIALRNFTVQEFSPSKSRIRYGEKPTTMIDEEILTGSEVLKTSVKGHPPHAALRLATRPPLLETTHFFLANEDFLASHSLPLPRVTPKISTPVPSSIQLHSSSYVHYSPPITTSSSLTNGTNDGPSNRIFDGPSNRSFDGPSNRPFDGPSNRIFDGPSSRPFDGPSNRIFDGPSNRIFDGPSNRSFDGPSNGSFNDPKTGHVHGKEKIGELSSPSANKVEENLLQKELRTLDAGFNANSTTDGIEKSQSPTNSSSSMISILENSSSSARDVFHFFVGVMASSIICIAFLLWRRRKRHRQDDEIPVFSRSSTEHENPTFADTSGTNSESQSNYRSFR